MQTFIGLGHTFLLKDVLFSMTKSEESLLETTQMIV